MADVTIGTYNIDLMGGFNAALESNYLSSSKPLECVMPFATYVPLAPLPALANPLDGCITNFSAVPIPDSYIPCVPTYDFNLNFTVCPHTSYNPIVDTGDPNNFKLVATDIAPDGSVCGYTMTGTLELCMACIPTFSVNFLEHGYGASSTSSAPGFSWVYDPGVDNAGCGWTLNGTFTNYDDIIAWILANMGGGPQPESCPFDFTHVNVGVMKVAPGNIANIPVDNTDTNISYSLAGKKYVVVHATTNGYTVTSATIEIVADGSPVLNPQEPKLGMAPSPDLYVVLGYINGGLELKTWPCYNIQAVTAEAYRTEKEDTVPPGTSPFDIYYIWNVTAA